MEDIFEQLHYEFVTSEDFIKYLSELYEYSNYINS